MQPWKHESIFPELLSDQSVLRHVGFANVTGSLITHEMRQEHMSTLQQVIEAIQRLQPYMANYDQEKTWVEQLLKYVDRLRSASPPHSPEEQFAQLYPLRKWLFWVPVSLLSARQAEPMVLAVSAHFYATALAIESIFPDIGDAFCCNMAQQPLEEILQRIAAPQATQSYSQVLQAAVYLMDFPRTQATMYRSKHTWSPHSSQDFPIIQAASYNLDALQLDLGMESMDYSYGGSLSPAFAPSPLHPITPGSILSGQRSPFLEVPRSSVDSLSFSGSSTAYTSPVGSPSGGGFALGSAPATPMGYVQEESLYSYQVPFSSAGYRGGFVASPTSIWT